MARRMKCIATSLLLGGFLFGSTGCDQDKVDQSTAPAGVDGEWHNACQEIKKRLGPEAEIKFQKFHSVGDRKLEVWTFAFYGMEVEIPQADYEVLPSVEMEGKDVSIILKAGDTIVSLIKSPPLDPMPDVYRKVGESLPNPGGIARTKQLFGKSPTVHELALLGFRHTPSDLTCNENERDREEPIAIALILKGAGPHREPVSVHRNIFGLDEITMRGKLESGSWEWESQISLPDRSLIAGVRTSKEDIYKDFLSPTTIRACNQDCKNIGPGWLKDLSEAAGNPAEVAKWKALKKSLEEGKASEKSLQAVTRQIDKLSVEKPAKNR